MKKRLLWPIVLIAAAPVFAQTEPQTQEQRDAWCDRHKDDEMRCLSNEDMGDVVKTAKSLTSGSDVEQTEALIDTFITVMTIAYPPAGVALGALKGVMDMLGFFDKPDMVGLALKQMDQRLRDVERNVHTLQKSFVQLQNSVYGNANYQNAQMLIEFEREAGRYARTLRERIDLRVRYETAMNARDLMRRFLDTPRLWQWHDLHIATRSNGEQFAYYQPARFRPMPTFDSYTAIMMTWIAAIEKHAQGSVATINHDYRADLERHIQFLRVRRGFREHMDTAQTAPEQIINGVSCYGQLSELYSDDRGTCGYSTICEDSFLRKRTSGEPIGRFPNPNALQGRRAACGMPAAFAPGQDRERELEDKYGVQAMHKLAERLERLLATGSSRESVDCFMSFDMTFYTNQYIYTLMPSGELAWQSHRINDDRNKPNSSTCGGLRPGISLTPSEMSQEVIKANTPGQRNVLDKLKPAVKGSSDTPSTPIAGTARSPLSPAVTTPSPTQTSAQPARKGLPLANPSTPVSSGKLTHGWIGPASEGTGWSGYRAIIPAGVSNSGASFYGLTADGTLKLHRHAGYQDGQPTWQPPIDVGTGWNAFRQIIGGGDGVLYAVAADGSLRWNRHTNFGDGSAPQWAPSTVVGTSWQHFVHIFSGGQGVIYAVQPDGRLMWYRHTGYQTGAPTWEGPRLVGKGWAHFRKLFSPGDGHVYAMQPTGELLWYRHLSFDKGFPSWQGPTSIAADWSPYTQVFPVMWGTPKPPQIN